jgi:hypothetical protein
MRIIALRFYKYVAPLGLKSQLVFFYKKYNNLSRATKWRGSERDSSETTCNGKRSEAVQVM